MAKYWTDGTSLYHYGIPGQKWGVQNGPPYPLGTKRLSSRERYKRYASKRSVLKLTDKQRTFVKTGVVIAASCLSVYGLYKIGQLSNNDLMSGKHETFAQISYRLMSEKYKVRQKTDPYNKPYKPSEGVAEFAKRNGIVIKDSIKSVDEDIDEILNNRPSDAHDDCVSLAFTQILKRMGLEVYPNHKVTNVYTDTFKYYFNNYSPVELEDLFKHNMSVSDNDAPSYNAKQSEQVLQRIKTLCKNDKEACGIMSITFLDELKGHTTPWFIENGVIRFGDIQAISKGDYRPVLGEDTVIDFRQGFSEFTLARLDNTIPTDALLYGTRDDPRSIIRTEKSNA